MYGVNAPVGKCVCVHFVGSCFSSIVFSASRKTANRPRSNFGEMSYEQKRTRTRARILHQVYGIGDLASQLASGTGWRLEVSEKKILRRIFGPCKDRRTGEWRKRHNWRSPEAFSTPQHHKRNVSQKTAWRKQGSITRTVIENDPAGKRPFGRPRLRWEDFVVKHA